MLRYYARFGGWPQRRPAQHPFGDIQRPPVGARLVDAGHRHARRQIRDEMK